MDNADKLAPPTSSELNKVYELPTLTNVDILGGSNTEREAVKEIVVDIRDRTNAGHVVDVWHEADRILALQTSVEETAFNLLSLLKRAHKEVEYLSAKIESFILKKVNNNEGK